MAEGFGGDTFYDVMHVALYYINNILHHTMHTSIQVCTECIYIAPKYRQFLKSGSNIEPGGKEQRDAICSAASLEDMGSPDITRQCAVRKYGEASFIFIGIAIRQDDEILRLQIIKDQMKKTNNISISLLY